MEKFSARYWLTFQGPCAHEPVVCEMVKAYPDITFNIKQASVSADSGIIALELSGTDEVVHNAVRWLESRGVRVEPVEIQTIEG
jgi:hypothetical protein